MAEVEGPIVTDAGTAGSVSAGNRLVVVGTLA